MVEGEALALDQSENDFSRSGRAWINDHQVPVAGISDVMVDVDPDFRRLNSRQRRAQPVLNCGVERDGNIHVLCCCGGFVSNSARGRNEYFSSMPSSFHIRTFLPSCWSDSPSASWLPSASPSGRT